MLGDIPTEKWSIGLVRKYRDYRGEQSCSRANKELAYIKRIFSWACEYEKTKLNPAKGVSKLTIAPRQHYANDEDYLFLLGVAKDSNYWYMPYMMELAYLCRMRLSEVTDFTDSDALEQGLLIRRRKIILLLGAQNYELFGIVQYVSALLFYPKKTTSH